MMHPLIERLIETLIERLLRSGNDFILVENFGSGHHEHLGRYEDQAAKGPFEKESATKIDSCLCVEQSDFPGSGSGWWVPFQMSHLYNSTKIRLRSGTCCAKLYKVCKVQNH